MTEGATPLLDIVSYFCMSYIKIENYGSRYKVILFKNVPPEFRSDSDFKVKMFVENDEKLSNNISRCRSRIMELSLCNPWEYFVTLTLSPEKYDRMDLKKYVADLGVWIGNYNKKFNTKLKYVLIPEQHKDGAWHMHGLLHDVAFNSLSPNRFGYYDIPYYSNKFGYLSISPVKDKNKCSSYITKYVSKDLGARASDLGAHLFYASHGLQGKNTLIAGWSELSFTPDYENDYVGIKWADTFEGVQQLVFSLC